MNLQYTMYQEDNGKWYIKRWQHANDHSGTIIGTYDDEETAKVEYDALIMFHKEHPLRQTFNRLDDGTGTRKQQRVGLMSGGNV